MEMKIVLWKNEELLEPYEGLPSDATIIATDDGYVYHENTANDPIDRAVDWNDWVDAEHQPEELGGGPRNMVEAEKICALAAASHAAAFAGWWEDHQAAKIGTPIPEARRNERERAQQRWDEAEAQRRKFEDGTLEALLELIHMLRGEGGR